MRVGLVQLSCSDDPAANLETTVRYVREAHAAGAQLIATPEVTNCLSLSRERQTRVLCAQDDDPTLAGLRALTKELSATLLIGSLALRTETPRFANRSFLIGPLGDILAQYDKIHMFDVELGSGERYAESDGYRPGEQAVVARLPNDGPHLGMTICYDIRFAALYRSLAQAGAQILAVPSAFTRPTGAAHWEVLLRARAIETGCFVIAPAQTGTHPAQPGERQRKTWGHALVVDPWGEVLLDMGTEPGVACVDLDLDAVAEARHRIPSLKHDRHFGPPEPYA